ncbi:MAG: hypothetical protein ABIN66_07480, partial [candidate division WOR-3 bacterium]
MLLSIGILGLIWENGTLPPAGRAYPAGFAGFFATDTSFDWLPVAYGADASMSFWQTNYWYDISANSWQTRTQGTAPARYDCAGTFAILDGEKQLFVFAGYRGSYNWTNASHRYRYSTDSWTNITNLPYSAEGVMAAGTIGGYIYVMGGRNLSGVRTSNYRYDPVGNSYLARAAIPEAKTEGACAIARNENGDSCVYLFAGIYGTNAFGLALHTQRTFEYNPVSDAWRERAQYPLAIHGMSAATLRNKIYIMGGT